MIHSVEPSGLAPSSNNVRADKIVNFVSNIHLMVCYYYYYCVCLYDCVCVCVCVFKFAVKKKFSVCLYNNECAVVFPLPMAFCLYMDICGHYYYYMLN